MPFNLLSLNKQGIQIKYGRNDVTESKSNMPGINALLGGIQPPWISISKCKSVNVIEYLNVYKVLNVYSPAVFFSAARRTL